jgi:hypothetical protein
LDVVPVLQRLGVSLSTLRSGMQAGFLSKPWRLLDQAALGLYDWLETTAATKLRGDALAAIRRQHPELASQGSAVSVGELST